ncbi:hypothetical protein Tcan_09041 [Toxocara canis]|uniref:Uncharacterized protein n=1 Tax=Toxocara canis TaxID=6265 RepID=A0A0B2V6B7_TOXCA|nr:hypothetical protein Tcan_09041 [Toxocara canis]
MVCQACNSFKAQLALKDEELKELNSKFATYKLKSKARLAQLKQSLTEGIPNAERWQEERATLLMRLAEAESEIENRQQEAEDLRSKLASREIELSDHAIRVRSLEEQLRSAWGDHTSVDERQCPADVEEMAKRDLGRMHSQMVYKDTRIMELNTTILDRERQILDLQEMCREQVQLLQAKARAFQIIQQRFLEIDSRTTKEASTETDLSLSLIGRSSASSMSGSARKEAMRARFRESTTPGHAVVQLRPGERMSPPPVDPSEDRSSFTTETATLLDEGDSELKTTAVATSASMEGKRKQRKKVTFDLTPQTAEAHGLDAAVDDEIAQAIIDLTTENDQLRRTIQEMETCAASELQKRIDQLEEEMQQVRRDGKNQALKARASAQGRIRELEERIAAMEQEQKDEVERLNANVETLRADREWTLEENAGLLKQLSTSRQKFEELREELDQSHVEYENLRTELAKDRDVIVKLADDVEEAQRTANLLFEQKMSILDDVDRLKEAIEAQGEYIDVLEADIVIYEEHVGLLRDSLGASKIEKRKLIKSKAFETKLRALEQEKEQMTRRNNGLDAAVDDEIAQAIIDLTTENDQLRRTIQEMETCAASELQKRIDQLEEEMQQVRRDGKNQALKARASAQGRIRELEERIAAMEQEQKDEVERLNANVETLRADREWTLEENAGLLKQLSTSRQKFEELREELDQSHVEYENLRTELAKDRDVIVKLADDVEEAQRTANLLFEQKMSILDDVDRLKEAIEAQGEYIDVLEADIVIYEEHVGLLRDSLGASKIEKRKLIKSKAFETKLRALEQEKEQMTRRNNEEGDCAMLDEVNLL